MQGQGKGTQDYFGIILENQQNLEKEGEMKAINSTSWRCLNTEMGSTGQKREQETKITTSVISVKTHKCVPCHLTLNLELRPEI